jgi:hypothetical protein
MNRGEMRLLLVLAVLAMIGVGVFWAAKEFRPQSEDPMVQQLASLREYVAKNFADPAAEITDVGTVVVWRDYDYRMFKVRHLNAMGGRVFTTWVAEFAGDEVSTAARFEQISSDARSKGVSDDEILAFARALDGSQMMDVREKKKAAQ